MHIVSRPALRGASPETCRGRSSGEARGRRCALGLIGRSGKPASLMRRLRLGLVSRTPGGPDQPSAGITTGCPPLFGAQGCTRRRRRSGGHRSGSRSHWGDLSPPGSAAQGDRKRRLNSPDCLKLVRVWSAGRRLPPIARRKETPRKRLGRPRQPLRERSQAPASAGAPLPSERERDEKGMTAHPGPTKECGR